MTRLLPAALALAVCGALFGQTRHYALVGFDSYPLIASARVRSMADALGLLTERLMDGRYPSLFYRPVVAASVAIDEALFGLAPAGYQATNLLLLAALAVAVAALVTRALGTGTVVGAIVGSAVLLLHSAVVEIAPVVARRADTLCALFMVLTLRAQLAPPSRGRFGLVALFAGLAGASKESAFVLPALCFALGWSWSGERVPRLRLRQAWSEAVPSVVALFVLLAVRVPVLGGLGGHGQTTPISALVSLPEVLLRTAAGATVPPDLLEPLPLPLVGAAVLAAWLAPLVLGAPSGGREDASAERRVARRRLAGLGLCWLAVVALAYALGGFIGAWYWLLPAVGLALALAALADGASASLRASDPATGERGLAGAAALAIAGVLLVQLSRSPLLHPYTGWSRASRASEAFLSALGASIETELERPAGNPISGGREGNRVTAPPLPVWVQPVSAPGAAPSGGPRVLGGAVLSDYSVQAWADLHFEQERIRVLGIEGGALSRSPREPAAGEIVVALDSIAAGF